MSSGGSEESANANHAGWERRLGAVLPLVKQLRERTSRPLVADRGSALAGDDTRAHPLGVSPTVGYKIAAALEHLEYVLDAAAATGTVYPTAQLSTLRTALLSSAEAVWLLEAPRRLDRIQRVIQIRADELRALVAFIQSTEPHDDGAAAALRRTLESTRAAQSEVQGLADRLGLAIRVDSHRLNATGVIQRAARVVYGDRVLQREGAMMFWRMGSQAAHAERTFALMRLNRSTHAVDGTTEYAQLAGDLTNDLGPMVAACYMFVDHAFTLWDSRARAS